MGSPLHRSPETALRLLALLGGMVALLVAGTAVAKPQRLQARDWRSIQLVIDRQINAFQLNEVDVAFALTSPGVRRAFESADNFMETVRSEYAAVYRPRAYRFLKSAIVGGEPVQAVEVVALDGAVSIALFSMERQRNGSWRISGCHLFASKQFAT